METGKQPPKQTGKYRVILRQAPDPGKAAEVILRRLGGTESHVYQLVNQLPAQIATDLDPLYAEDIAGALRAIGAEAEKRLIPSSVLCSEHPGQPGRALCLVCGKVVCSLCMKEAGGQPLCLEHSGKNKPEIPSAFPWVRVMLLLILIGVGLYGYYVLTRARAPFPWNRPYKLAVVGFMVELPPKWRGYVIKFQKETGKEYVDLRNHTLPDMEGWFQREYNRYGGTMPDALDLEIFGPYDEMVDPPKPPTQDQGFFDRFIQWRRFRDHFRKLNHRHELNLDKFDGVLYVQFVRGDFDRFKESWASKRYNLGLVNCYLNKDLVEQNIMIVLHEFFHLLNAKDHYDADLNPKVPEGLADPFADPLYPQAYADVMAGRVAEGKGISREIMGLGELRVNVYTAHEIGWISDEEFERMMREQKVPSLA